MGLLIAEVMQIAVGCNFVATGMNFADQIGKTLCYPAENEESCTQL